MDTVMKELINKLVDKKSLSANEVTAAFDCIFAGDATDAQIAGFLVALRMKGETPEEIAAAALTMRRNATKVKAPEGRKTIDTCGTGGDGHSTFNISTTSAFVVAAAGATVVKHGNRGVSSKCGSADVLTAAGVNVNVEATIIEQCLKDLGIGFLFAPALHGAMKHVVAPRAELGMRSIFNIIGPLCNPAGATHQLLGVYTPDLVKTVAETLALLGTERALVVHGENGLDEVSPCGPTSACLVENGALTEFLIEPKDIGIEPISIDQIAGNDPAENAQIMRDVLSGKPGPHRDAVVLNTGAAIWIAGISVDLASGAEVARAKLDEGSALAKLEGLIELTKAGTTDK